MKIAAISMQAHGVGARVRSDACMLIGIALIVAGIALAGPAMATVAMPVVAPAATPPATAESEAADVAVDPAAGPFVAPAPAESRARPIGAAPDFLVPDANPGHWISREIKLRAAFAAAVADPAFRLLIGAGVCLIVLAAYIRRRRRRQPW